MKRLDASSDPAAIVHGVVPCRVGFTLLTRAIRYCALNTAMYEARPLRAVIVDLEAVAVRVGPSPPYLEHAIIEYTSSRIEQL